MPADASCGGRAHPHAPAKHLRDLRQMALPAPSEGPFGASERIRMCHARLMAHLVVITGPIAAGKNTVASLLAERLTASGCSTVVADVDDVAAMVAGRGAGGTGLRFAAHQAHGALVGQWMRTAAVDVVIAVGPIYTPEEQAALLVSVPEPSAVEWVVVDAPVSVTLARAQAEPRRGLSREPGFHAGAHERFRRLRSGIPATQTYDSSQLSAEQIAASIFRRVGGRCYRSLMNRQDLFLMSDAALRDVIDMIDPDQLSLAAPAEWSRKPNPTLRDIVAAHAFDEAWVPDVLAGRTAEEVGSRYDADLLGDDPIASYDEINDAATDAVARDLDYDTIVHLSYGDFTAGDYLEHTSIYRAFQAWSIAHFLGLGYALPDPLVDGLWEIIAPQIDAFRAMGAFPPEVDVPEGSDSQTRLLGKAGYWRP